MAETTQFGGDEQERCESCGNPLGEHWRGRACVSQERNGGAMRMMTPEQWAEATKRIGIGLLGWNHDPDYGFWAHNRNEIIGDDPFFSLDWCAEFEKELAQRGWFERYAQILIGAGEDVDQWHVLSGISVYADKGPADRVDACLRVMKHKGLLGEAEKA